MNDNQIKQSQRSTLLIFSLSFICFVRRSSNWFISLQSVLFTHWIRRKISKSFLENSLKLFANVNKKQWTWSLFLIEYEQRTNKNFRRRSTFIWASRLKWINASDQTRSSRNCASRNWTKNAFFRSRNIHFVSMSLGHLLTG